MDPVHLASLRAALLTGGWHEVTDTGESEDFGPDWRTPRALVEFGEREPTPPWRWSGPRRAVRGPTWGGCLEVLVELALADRVPPPRHLEGAILLVETSEELPTPAEVRRWLRALGERGLLAEVAGVLTARPPVSAPGAVPAAPDRARLRAEQAEVVHDVFGAYAPDAVVCTGVPFGHTRPQWILPYGGVLDLDGLARTVRAHYG